MTDIDLSNERIAEMREIVAAATPGPWECIEGTRGEGLVGGPNGEDVTGWIAKADAKAIVTLRNAAPALLDEILRLRAEKEECDVDLLRAENERLRADVAMLTEYRAIAARLHQEIERLREALEASVQACVSCMAPNYCQRCLDQLAALKESQS